MAEYKYPYIANKRMYCAVMGACKWIRESGYFNKAVSYYADKYGVDEAELAKHIRARQSAGQKGKKRGTYKHYVVITWESCDADGEAHLIAINVKKAMNEQNARQSWLDFQRRNDYGGSYAPYRFDEVLNEFATKNEADTKRKMLLTLLDKHFKNKTVYQTDFERIAF